MFQHQDIARIVEKLPSASGQEQRPLDWITMLIVHHSAIEWTGGDVVETLTAEANYQNNTSIPGSHGLQYHMVIDPTDGTIYQTNDWTTLCWHAGDYPTNQHSLAIMVLGNYQDQQITDAGRKALDNLIWMLSSNATGDFTNLSNINTYDGNSLKTHQEVDTLPGSTACCGANLIPIVENARNTKMQSEVDYFNSKVSQSSAPEHTYSIRIKSAIWQTTQDLTDAKDKLQQLENEVNSEYWLNMDIVDENGNMIADMDSTIKDQILAIKTASGIKDAQIEKLQATLEDTQTKAQEQSDKDSAALKAAQETIIKLQNKSTAPATGPVVANDPNTHVLNMSVTQAFSVFGQFVSWEMSKLFKRK